jgi:hypothetical protein
MQLSQTARRVLWTGGWALSVLGAFAAGFWVASYMLGTVLSTNYLTRELVEAIRAQNDLELLDERSPERLRQSLSLRVDSHILALAALAEHSVSATDRGAADRFLRRVAEHRRKHKATYPDGLSSGEQRETQKMIAEILESEARPR